MAEPEIFYCNVCRAKTRHRIEGDEEIGYLAQCEVCGTIQTSPRKPQDLRGGAGRPPDKGPNQL